MKQKKALLGITGLLILTCVLYIPNMNRVMYCDEANTLYQYASNLPRALFSYATPNNHILHSFGVWFITQFAGTSAPVVRFIAFSAALLSIALIYRIGARLANPRAGIAAAVFLATNLFFADFAINARGYTLSVLLTLAMIYMVLIAQDSKLRRYLLMGISAALVLVLPSMLLLHAGVVGWAVLDKHRRQNINAYILPVIFGALIGMADYAPSIAFGLLNEHFSLYGETNLLTLVVQVAQQTFATPITGIVFAAFSLIGLLPFSFASFGLTSEFRLRGFVLTLLVITLAVSLVQLLVLDKLFWARNYLYLLAPIALLAGVGFSRLVTNRSLVAVFALAALIIFPVGFLNGDYEEKQVIELINRNLSANDQIIAAPCFNAPVLHYLAHNDRGEQLFSTPTTERVFVLTNNFPLQQVIDQFDAQVSSCQPVTDGSWGAFDVYLCRPA